MKTSQTLNTNAALIAQLLDRLEHSARPDADQYRLVVQRLAAELGRVQDADALDALLSASPAAAELYENLNYQHAGLCRSLLDASLAAELSARDAIARAMRPAAEDSSARSAG
jgi:hypothetical protein